MEAFLQSIDALTVIFTLTAVLMPLAAFVFNIAMRGKWYKMSGWLSTAAILLSCILSGFVFARVWNGHRVHQQHLWFTIGHTKLYIGILLNNLSVLMLLLVSVIALPVHIYSTAYMKNDEHYSRYFAFLSFFCFSMLALVVVDNLILFYVFWELVGFSSYLLIGFWFKRHKAVMANKKAFIMNRVGDMGLLIAIIVLFTQYHTFDITQIFADNGLISRSFMRNGFWVAPAGQLPVIWQYIACGGIFLGVAAKSAQFPLHTWLPDAMEGPTSVSALIHAATMVAAGVFLLGRVYPMFNGTELTILAIIGCFTAFMAATIALTQNDLKRILAYSTISQLGYMVMAMGIGAYASSLFHLVTHAFFKALLFLVAGIVIHQMRHINDDNDLGIDPQNIQHMGGLRKKLPFTFIAAIIGGLALVGLPLTSGYLSKDSILIHAFEWSDGKGPLFKLIPVFALLTTWLTAFYVARLIVKVFFGELRLLKHTPGLKLHISDGSWAYKLPLVLLAAGCLFPLFSANPIAFTGSWLFNSFPPAGGSGAESSAYALLPVLVNILSLLVIYWAWLIYARQKAGVIPQRGFLYRLSLNAWYFDEIYNNGIIKPVLALGRFTFWFDRIIINGSVNSLARTGILVSKLSSWFDRRIIDGFLNLLVAIVRAIGNFARKFQNGRVQYYLFSMLVIILSLFILKILV
ncbi:MAG: NADH-quinone oxidoreductase subunit L [Sphingobacteriales bacterium]